MSRTVGWQIRCARHYLGQRSAGKRCKWLIIKPLYFIALTTERRLGASCENRRDE